MKQYLASVTLMLLLSLSVNGQEKKPVDPFDLSATDKITKELGVPTVQEVATLEIKAKTLLDAGNCEAAVAALEEYAKKANWLANLFAAGLQPYYGASYESNYILDRPSQLL